MFERGMQSENQSISLFDSFIVAKLPEELVSESRKKVKVLCSRTAELRGNSDVFPPASRILSTEVLSSERILKYSLLRHDKMLFSVDALCIYKAKGDSENGFS